jgi:hypothetical protein
LRPIVVPIPSQKLLKGIGLCSFYHIFLLFGGLFTEGKKEVKEYDWFKTSSKKIVEKVLTRTASIGELDGEPMVHIMRGIIQRALWVYRKRCGSIVAVGLDFVSDE